MIHDVVVHFVTTVWRRNPGSSVAALCDALLIYSLHGRVYTYSHDQTSVMSP